MSVMTAYLSLSPLLHFVLKFSIQKIKGGGKTSERAGKRTGGKKSAIMDFILNPLPVSPQKETTAVQKNVHFILTNPA